MINRVPVEVSMVSNVVEQKQMGFLEIMLSACLDYTISCCSVVAKIHIYFDIQFERITNTANKISITRELYFHHEVVVATSGGRLGYLTMEF